MYDVDYHSHKNIGASIEWITPDIGFIRGGNGWVWGDPYQFTCIIIIAGTTAVIKGYLGIYDKSIRECIRILCRNSGIKKITFERMNQKTRRTIEFSTT